MSAQVLTLEGERQTLSDETVEEIRAIFRGAVLTADDVGYDEARIIQNAMLDRRPGLIVRCTGTADVVDAVKMATERNLLVAVRGGGHSIAGSCTADDALMIDLSVMRGVWVDPERRRVRVAGGATWGDVDRETQLHGLAVPGGVVSTTGVAGLTLGGGIGWLHRKYGLACDALRAADVVTVRGDIVRCSASEHEDLFWALRGGGGNFGVVVSFEFEAYPLGPVVWNGMVVYPIDAAAEVLPRWRDWTSTVPDEVTSRAMFWTLPAVPPFPPSVHNRDVFMMAALYAGDPDEGRRACRELGEFGRPLADMSQALSYRTAQSALDPLFPKGELQSYWKSVYLDRLDEETTGFVVRVGQDRPSPKTLVHAPLMGGAMSRVGATETAFGDRGARYILSLDGNWLDPADNDVNIRWVRDAYHEAVTLRAASGTYLNFGGDADLDDDDRVRAWGRNVERLRQVKRSYDPENRLRLNPNIPPAEN
ncbi:FAD-binding oxidoreductase [Pseudofrankia inefficax]|uniref:FAD linked oxidase domain protein n=1 Tax=Pseudofrankia inefficax (strain DSM 45817 / CECT 9037 / DDB 130130 / EuI1c) TaxID=298654 RepID=E3IWJ0_PSEI1|nr:FAD-binding oxidoreductase [Pseudofrankia inefficax]ADP80173.1 FAD linked oxidase domain protein [Pseudofrankia inefficax]